jgi:integrase
LLAKKPLTDRGIAALKQPASGKLKLYYDAIVPGLALRVTANGAKSFVLVGRFPGSSNPTARVIAKYGAMGLDDVRATARKWLGQLAAGVDPAHAAQATARDTLRAICEEYQSREGSRLRSASHRQATLERLVYPVLGSVPIASLRRTDVVRLLDQVEDQRGRVMANRTLGILGRIFNWHASRSDEFRSPIVRGMSRGEEQARDRVLTDDELRAVWAKSGNAKSGVEPVSGAFIRFLLLTGARRNEAAKIEWSEIAGGDWTLPASRNKTGVELVRPLSRAARAVLAQLPRNGDWVFTRTGRRPLNNFAELKAEIDCASGTSGWTLHDLRRTARSLMSRVGVPSDHAERCLGHVVGGVRGVYDRHQYLDEMLIAYEKLAGLIDRIVDPQANVVAIHRV